MAVVRAKPRSNPLAEALDERVAELHELARRAFRSGDVKAVHHARVTTRRLKAALDLLAPLLPRDGTEKFAKALRRLRRALGPLRDLDVMLGHLKELDAPPELAPAVAWVARQMRQRRAKVRRDHAGGASTERLQHLHAWNELKQPVAESYEHARRLLRRTAPNQLRSFSGRADRLARQAEGKAASGNSNGRSENVHELRVAGKLLRYTLELAAVLGYEVPESVAHDFKKLQDALGLWHDYAVLSEESLRLAVTHELAMSDPEIFSAVLRLAPAMWEQSRRHLAEFVRLWTERGDALSGAALAAFDEAQPA